MKDKPAAPTIPPAHLCALWAQIARTLGQVMP